MSFPFQIDVIVKDPDWKKLATGEKFDELAREAVHSALALSGAQITGPAELSIVLTSDIEQRALNKKWRKIDGPTNVLSFPLLEPFSPVFGMLGDITLARETVLAEAKKQQKSWEAHFSHLVVHGILHILGYDHQTKDEAFTMESLETNILNGLGVSDPYRE